MLHVTERYCTNCRAELPAGERQCLQCGVYAGEVFDGRLPGRRRRVRGWILVLPLLLGAAAAVFWLRPPQRGVEMPIGVVNRPAGARRAPGAKLSEPEAIRMLRRHLVGESLKAECLAISSQGWRDGHYHLTALNSCQGTRLGGWRVDAVSGTVLRR